MDSSKRFSNGWSELPLSQRIDIASKRTNVNTKEGMTNALFNATKFDDQLFSKDFDGIFNEAKAKGLIDRADARAIEKYRTDRVVDLYKEGKGKYFVGREYRPDASEDRIAEQRASIKADLRDQMGFARQERDYALNQMGYTPEDYARFEQDKSGYRDLPIAGRVEVPFLSESFKQDPLRELGIGVYQSGKIASGVSEGFATPFEALGRRFTGQDPSFALQETGNPLTDSGQIIGESAINRAATIPYGIIGSRALTRGSSLLFGAATSALGNAIGGAKLGARFGPTGAILGGVMGGIAGMVGGSYLGELANEKIADMALGRDANQAMKATRESLQIQYPFAARLGDEAPDLAMFGPSFKAHGFSAKKAISGFKRSGLRGLGKGITDQNALVADLGERFGEGAMNVVMAARQSERERQSGGPGKTAWDILAEGAMGVFMQGETRLGRQVYGGLNKGLDRITQSALTKMAGKSAMAQQPVANAQQLPEGMRRINLGGRLESATNAAGEPVIKGARYAVYDPKTRKAWIHTDNDFALAGERTKAAAFSLGGTDTVFRRNPILIYKDASTNQDRMILGITRDAGVVVRDITPTGQSSVSTVPVSQIRNEKINKRLVEAMAAQGVKPNPAPAPFMPDVMLSADKSVFPDTVSLDSKFEAIPARVVSKIGGKATNAYLVALPDGTHIRANAGMINTQGAEPIVRGRIEESMFPQSLSDLMPQRKRYDRHVRVGEGDKATHLQLTDTGFGRTWKQVSNMFDADRQAIMREPNAEKRQAAIDVLHNKIANEIDRQGLFEPTSIDLPEGAVVTVKVPDFGKFKGMPAQDAIVVGKNKYGHEVVLPDHQEFGTFTVHDSDIDPASAVIAKMGVSNLGDVSTGGDITNAPRSTVARDGAALSNAPGESVRARHVAYQTQPQSIRKKINEAVAGLLSSPESPIGKSVEVSDASANTHIHAKVVVHNPGRLSYRLQTTEFDPATRAEKDQYVTLYEATYDPDTDEWTISHLEPTAFENVMGHEPADFALYNLGDIARIQPEDYAAYLREQGISFANKDVENIASAGYRFASFLQAKYKDRFIAKDTITLDDLNEAAKKWFTDTRQYVVDVNNNLNVREEREINWRAYIDFSPVILAEPDKIPIGRFTNDPATGKPYPDATEIDRALIPGNVTSILNHPDKTLYDFAARVNVSRMRQVAKNFEAGQKAINSSAKNRKAAFQVAAILSEADKYGSRVQMDTDGNWRQQVIQLAKNNDAISVPLNVTIINNAVKYMSQGQTSKDALMKAHFEYVTTRKTQDKLNGWIVLPQSYAPEAVPEIQRLCAATNWCVGQQNHYPGDYREKGPFHIYMENGRAVIGISTDEDGNDIEINGVGPNQSMTVRDEAILDKYVADGNLPNYQDRIYKKQVLDAVAAVGRNIATDEHINVIRNAYSPTSFIYDLPEILAKNTVKTSRLYADDFIDTSGDDSIGDQLTALLDIKAVRNAVHDVIDGDRSVPVLDRIVDLFNKQQRRHQIINISIDEFTPDIISDLYDFAGKIQNLNLRTSVGIDARDAEIHDTDYATLESAELSIKNATVVLTKNFGLDNVPRKLHGKLHIKSEPGKNYIVQLTNNYIDELTLTNVQAQITNNTRDRLNDFIEVNNSRLVLTSGLNTQVAGKVIMNGSWVTSLYGGTKVFASYADSKPSEVQIIDQNVTAILNHNNTRYNFDKNNRNATIDIQYYQGIDNAKEIYDPHLVTNIGEFIFGNGSAYESNIFNSNRDSTKLAYANTPIKITLKNRTDQDVKLLFAENSSDDVTIVPTDLNFGVLKIDTRANDKPVSLRIQDDSDRRLDINVQSGINDAVPPLLIFNQSKRGIALAQQGQRAGFRIIDPGEKGIAVTRPQKVDAKFVFTKERFMGSASKQMLLTIDMSGNTGRATGNPVFDMLLTDRDVSFMREIMPNFADAAKQVRVYLPGSLMTYINTGQQNTLTKEFLRTYLKQDARGNAVILDPKGYLWASASFNNKQSDSDVIDNINNSGTSMTTEEATLLNLYDGYRLQGVRQDGQFVQLLHNPEDLLARSQTLRQPTTPAHRLAAILFGDESAKWGQPDMDALLHRLDWRVVLKLKDLLTADNYLGNNGSFFDINQYKTPELIRAIKALYNAQNIIDNDPLWRVAYARLHQYDPSLAESRASVILRDYLRSAHGARETNATRAFAFMLAIQDLRVSDINSQADIVMKSTEQAVRALASMLHNYRNLIQSVDSMLANPQAIFDLQNNSIYTGKIDNDFTTWTNGEKLYNYSHIYRRPDDLGRSFIYEVMHFGTPNAIENYNQLTQDQGRWEIISPVWRNHIPSDYYSSTIGDYLSQSDAQKYGPSVPDDYLTRADQSTVDNDVMFQTNEPDQPGEAAQNQPRTPRPYTRKKYFVARVPTDARFKTYYAEHARIEHQFYNDPKKMKTELNKLNRAYADILADVMPKLLDALDKAARQKRPSLKSRDLSFTSERKGYTLRRWENQDFTNLSGRSDLAGTGNAKEVHSILANIAGNNYLVNVQTVSNSKQLASVLREQYKFDADAATGVSEIVDRFARAWALEKVKSQIGRSLDTVEVTGQLARNKEAGIRPFTINSEDLLFKRSAREEPEILKATAEYMREFYRERFAAFGVIDQAHDFDQKYKGAIFRGAKKDNLAFNIIVGFASRDQSTGIHEIAHALLRSMSNDMRKAIITNMMKHNRRAQLNTTDNGNVKLPVDIEEMWATAFESSLMLKRYPVRYDAHNPNAKGAPDPTLVKVWNEVGEYLRGCVDIVHEQMESDGRFVDPRKAAYQVQWYAPLKDDQKMFKNMGVVVNTTNGMKHAVVNKAQANIDDPISVIFEDGTSALINRIDIVRLGGWSTGFNDSTLDTISQWLGSYYADAGGRVGHRQKMETSFPELFADYDANTIQRGQINASATEAARFQEVDANDVHDAVSSIVPMSIAEYLKLVKDGIMPPTRDGRYLEIDKKIAIARANVALSMAIDNKPNWEAALQYVPTLGTSAESIEPFTKTPWVSKRELVLLAKQLNPSLDENQLWQTYQKLSSHGVKNVTRVFFDKKGSGPQLVVPASEAPTLAAIVQMRQDGLSMSFASKVFASKIDKSVTEQYITPDEFDNISMQVMGVKYSDRDQRRIFNDLNIIPHLVRDARTNNYAFLPQHITILKAVAEARKQQVAEFEKTPLISGQTYKTGPSWAKIKDRLVNNGDYVDAYNYIVNHPQYISKGRELTLEPLTQHGNKKYFHGNSYTNVEPTGLFQTNEQPHPNTKIASLSSDNQIRTALSTIVGQGRVQFSNGKINSVSDRNGNPSNVYRMLTNNHGYDDRTALGLYAMTETAGFKKWSGSHPILEAVVNDDVRPDISIDKLTPNERISVRKYLSGKAILAVMADTSALSDSDVDTLAVQLQDYYREKNLSIDDITKQLDELLDGNNTDRLVAFMAAIESELRSSRYDNVRQHMRSADSYRDASSIIRTGKPFVSVAMSPKNSAGYLKHLGGYVLPSGVTSMDGDSLTAKYVRMDNPQVKDLKGQGITFPQVEAMLENAVKAKRDGLVLLNVNHTVGGMSVLHNIVIPRNSHKLRSIDVHPKISLASYFSGAGTLEVGAKSFAIPALAVEYDNKIARIYEQNHGNHVLNADVLTIDPETLKGVQWFHASPVCTDVSNAKTVGRVKGVDRSTDRDRDFARAVANVITTARPPIVTIENTEAYAKTSALKIITDALDGYTYDIGVYNSKDYGSPTDRKRMFVRAMLMPSNGVLPPVPSKLPTTVSWMDAIQDILPKLPIDPTPGSNTRMTESLRRAGMDWNNVPYPVLVQATQHWIPRPPDKPAPTIVASDGQSFRVVMPGGLVYKLNKDAIRRLQGLPDDFILPDTHKFAQKIIGNGIPPQLTNALVSPLVKNHLDGQMQRIADGYADSHEPALFQTAYDPVDPQSRYRYTETHNVPGAPYYVERITPRSAPTSQGRLWNVLDQINDISRLVLSGDLAFATLQGGILGLSTPRVGIKAFYAGLHGFAPNLQVEIGGQKYGYGKIGREVFHQIGDGLRANPMYEIAREAGLPLSMYEIDDRVKARKEEMLHNLRQTNPSATMDDIQIDMMTIDELGANDEWYMKGRFTQHLPMQGQFERFNVIMHDVLLLTQFDNWNKVLLSKGYEPGTEKYKSAMRDAARILSVAIGDIKYSTDTQKDATASRFAKVLFTAPRWLMSRALIDPFINPIISNSALFSKLREVMGEDNPAFHLYAGNKDVSMLGQSLWLRLAGVQLAMIIMALIYQNWNPDVEVDVTRNFGRVRVGDFRIDPAAGQFDHWKLAIRMTTALLGTDSTAVKKAQRERLPYWLYQIKDVSKELQYKMSPMLNTAISLLGGNDYQGFYENPFGSVMTGRSLSVVGNGYFSKSDTAQAFYDSVLKPGVADIFGQQAADNVSVSNAIVERLPTLFPQMFDALQRAMDYDRPVAAYVAANTIPNWLGFKVEVAPSEELKTRVRRKNQVTPQESPTLIKMLAEGRLREIVSGTDKPPVKPWGSEWGMK